MAASQVPRIGTARLVLRGFVKDDAPAVFAIFSDPRVSEFYDLDTFPHRGQADQLVAKRMQGYPNSGCSSVSWAICLAGNPDLAIGYCGIHSANPAFRSVMIGYDLHPDHWGKGIALEAVSAMLGYCWARDFPFAINRIAATTDLESRRSIKLLKRLGFMEEGVLRQFGFWKGAFQDVRMFALLRSQWQAPMLNGMPLPQAPPLP